MTRGRVQVEISQAPSHLWQTSQQDKRADSGLSDLMAVSCKDHVDGHISNEHEITAPKYVLVEQRKPPY